MICRYNALPSTFVRSKLVAMTEQPTSTSARRDPAPGALELVREFVNTHDYEDGSEQFPTPSALRDWLSGHGLLAADEPVSEADLGRTIEVREALRALCLANNGEPLEQAAVDALNSAARVSPVLVRFDQAGRADDLAPAGGGVPAALASLLAIVHAAMAEGTWERLKVCPAHDCLWAFYDHSRNRSGHWCVMSVCGNRAKARSYRERHRGDA